MDSYRVFDEIVGFSASGFRISLQWMTYDFLRIDDSGTRSIGRASATSVLTMIGIIIILIPVLRRTFKEQKEKRAKGQLMGIGISSFTEVVGAGPSKDFDILGIKMFDSSEIRIHPTGKAIARFGTKSQGQGHETTYAQIIAEELGIPFTDVSVEEGDTDTAPYGLGTYASRSTPTAGAAAAMACRKIKAKAKKIAAHLLETSEEDLEWEVGKFSVKGVPDKSVTIQDIAFAILEGI